jgi:hypothetical protein
MSFPMIGLYYPTATRFCEWQVLDTLSNDNCNTSSYATSVPEVTNQILAHHIPLPLADRNQIIPQVLNEVGIGTERRSILTTPRI